MIVATARHLGRSLLRASALAIALLPACEKGSEAPDASTPTPADRAVAAADVPPPAPALPPAEEILAKGAEAMGGAEAAAAVHSFYFASTIEIVGQNIHGTLKIWWKDGDFYMEQVLPGIGELRAGRKGDEVWADDPVHGLRALHGVEAEQYGWASTLLLVADWKRYFDRAETVAERTQDGRTLYDVKLSAESGVELTLSFDAKTGLQVAQSFEQITPMGKAPFEIEFQDYREVDGIKIAFSQVVDAKVHRIEQTIAEVKLGVEVDETRFQMPRRGGDLVRQAKRAAQ